MAKNKRNNSKVKKIKNDPLSKITGLSKNKKSAILFVLAFTIVGGVFIARGFAASSPPPILLGWQGVGPVNTVDGQSGQHLMCIESKTLTPYGPATPCQQ